MFNSDCRTQTTNASDLVLCVCVCMAGGFFFFFDGTPNYPLKKNLVALCGSA